MGTLFRVQVFAANEDSASRAAQRAFEEARRLDRLLSDYRQDSGLMELCRKPTGIEHGVAAELHELLSHSLDLHRLSDGAFDVTVGHLSKEWRRAARKGRLPAAANLAKALRARGMADLKVSEERCSVILGKPGMLLDLGGIAKGYAADRMLEVLVAQGCSVAIVSAGGDLRVGESPPGDAGWEVVLRPFGAAGAQRGALKVVVADCAVSTSGSVHQFVEIEGRRYSHIVNPATGLGIDPGLACTVVARSGMVSDPMATTCCVLGIEKGFTLAEKVGVEVLFAVSRGDGDAPQAERIQLKHSSGFPFLNEAGEKGAVNPVGGGLHEAGRRQ